MPFSKTPTFFLLTARPTLPCFRSTRLLHKCLLLHRIGSYPLPVYVPLRVCISLSVHPIYVTHRYVTQPVCVPPRMFPTPCVSHSVFPTSCLSRSVFPTPCVPLCISHSFHSVNMPICVHPTLCVFHFVYVPLCECSVRVPLLYPTPISYSYI